MKFDENHSPLQANIRWSVKLNKTDFIGKKAILNDYFKKYNDILTGFEVLGRAIPRNNMNILDENNNIIGHVTSGSFSPTLSKNIGIAYIKPDFINKDNLKIQIRNKIENIKLINLPFYKRQI